MAVAAAGRASPPLEVAGAPPLEVAVQVVLCALFLGFLVPATLRIGYGLCNGLELGDRGRLRRIGQR